MNHENQKIIIQIFGGCTLLLLTGIILITYKQGYQPELTTSLTGLVMVFATALATFLSTKTMTEKQETTLEQYYTNQTPTQTHELQFTTQAELQQYLAEHTIEDIIQQTTTKETQEDKQDVQQ
ncbi:MAG: hypothetical protein BZ136_08520 [Methanosphaera sp. rholeuAM74]|nr:MAG: hypothetical protein BZ136_08520 [Methanosphaera sp. rholeuAM74]